jgi:hydrogenase/urease accessory protein HupE
MPLPESLDRVTIASMGLLVNFDPRLSDYSVVGLTAIVALTVSFKHGGSLTIDTSTTNEKHSSPPTSS